MIAEVGLQVDPLVCQGPYVLFPTAGHGHISNCLSTLAVWLLRVKKVCLRANVYCYCVKTTKTVCIASRIDLQKMAYLFPTFFHSFILSLVVVIE